MARVSSFILPQPTVGPSISSSSAETALSVAGLADAVEAHLERLADRAEQGVGGGGLLVHRAGQLDVGGDAGLLLGRGLVGAGGQRPQGEDGP